MMRRVWGLAFGLAGLVFLAGCPRSAGDGGGGCSKDRDCKGDRICERGACVEPHRAAPSPPRTAGVVRAPDGGPAAAKPSAPGEMRGPAPVAMLGGGPQHTGRAPGAVPQSEPKLLWEFATKGPIAAPPLVGPDGVVYVGSHDGNLYAVKDGKELWHFTTGDRVWSTPALAAGGTVYVGSDDDFLYALDGKTGAKKWALQIGACKPTTGKGPQAVKCDVDGAVTIGPDGTVYVGGDGIYAVSGQGKQLWRAPTGDHVSSPPALSLDGQTLYAGSQDHAIYAVDALNGSLRWSLRTEDQVEPAPVIGQDGTIYIGGDDRKLRALHPTGELAWALITGGDIPRAAALAADGTIYVATHDKNLYAVKPDGVVAWTFATAGKIHCSPVVGADGSILIGSEDDRVYAVSPMGVLMWYLDLGDDVDAQPWIAPDGTIYIGADTGKLRAYK